MALVTTRQSHHRQRMVAWLRSLRAGPCELCGEKRHKRELAHVRQTSLDGRGRGLERRYYDVKRHPDAYARLCTRCHGRLDLGRAAPQRRTRGDLGLEGDTLCA